VTGMEVKGHITGQAITAFYKGGIDADGRIIGSVGAIPFIQNLDADAIARFQEQIVEVVDLVDTERYQPRSRHALQRILALLMLSRC